MVTGRYVHTTEARVGWIGGVGQTYSIKYSFPTRAGKKYDGSVDVTKEQAMSIEDGAPIRIKYDSNTPGINSAVDFENDQSNIAENEEKPYGALVTAIRLVLLGGSWPTWRNWHHIREDMEGRRSTPTYPMLACQ